MHMVFTRYNEFTIAENINFLFMKFLYGMEVAIMQCRGNERGKVLEEQITEVNLPVTVE